MLSGIEVIKVDIKDIKIGDILDVYIEGESVQRIVVIEIGEEFVFGIDSNGEEFGVEPRSEVERVVGNIDDLM
jgi:hypothetical protein